MQNILVPTDFSIKSFNALKLAKELAKKTGGTIHLLHVVEPPYGGYSSMGESMEDSLDDVFTVKLAAKLGKDLNALKTAHQEDSLSIKAVVKIGDPKEEIRQLAEEVQADLVIVGAKGVSDAEEFFVGSLTEKVVRSMSCPVITVNDVVDENDFANIVYATNLQEDHQPLLKLLMRFQELFNSTIHIVRVNTRNMYKNEIDTKVALQRLADQYQLQNYTLTSYSHEDEEYGIVYFADEKKADLIVMGIHEKGRFRRLVSGGSLADEVTDHTFRPVLTYRFAPSA